MQTEGAMILITDKWSLLQGMYKRIIQDLDLRTLQQIVNFFRRFILHKTNFCRSRAIRKIRNNCHATEQLTTFPPVV